MSKNRKLILLSFSVACFIAILTCMIVNFAIDRSVTWSAYLLISVPYFWLIFLPLIAMKHGLTFSVCSLSVFAIPYLYLLEIITPVHGWFMPLGIQCAIIGIVLAWLIYLLLRFVKISMWYRSAVIVFLAGVAANPVLQYLIDKQFEPEPKTITVGTILNAAGCLVISVILVVVGRMKTKAKSAGSSVQ